MWLTWAASESLGQALLRELETFRLEVAKEEAIQAAIALDTAHAEQLCAAKEAEARAVLAEIAALRGTLETELGKKANKAEYQALAKLILALPAPDESRAAAEELAQSVREAEARHADLSAEYEQRTQQFQQLVFALHGLQRELGESGSATEAGRRKTKRALEGSGERAGKRARGEAQ